MKVLVVGLGSMGKRRVRNLIALGVDQIAGFDLRSDRRAEATEKYSIQAYSDFSAALTNALPDVLVISTPPQHHMTYAWAGFEHSVSCFIEASVVDADRILELHRRTEGTSLVMAPSCTMRYYPGPKKVKQLLGERVIGRPLNVNYHVGQYLPDWHPWERIQDFYVSTRESGGARELVPFEITWLNDLFGVSSPLACTKAKLTDMAADIDDIYHCLLGFSSGTLASVTIEVISRPVSTRELRIIGTEGVLVFSGSENRVRYINAANPEWVSCDLVAGTVEKGYINPEEPYVEEMRDFLQAVTERDRTRYPNTLLDDYNVLQTLYRLEALSGGSDELSAAPA